MATKVSPKKRDPEAQAKSDKNPGGILKASGRKIQHPNFADPFVPDPWKSHRIVHFSDTQFGLMGWLKNSKKNEAVFVKPHEEIAAITVDFNPRFNAETSYKKEMKVGEACVKFVNKQANPPTSFVIHGGNQVNAFPGDPERKQQLADFHTVFSGFRENVPMMLVPGEHDVGEEPTAETIDTWKEMFGDDYYEFWHLGVRYFMLNTTIYRKKWPEGSEQKRMGGEQLKWFEGKITDGQKAKHHVVVSHIPPYVTENPDEADSFWNMEMGIRKTFLDLVANNTTSAAWFGGHYHNQTDSKYGIKYKHVAIEISGACGTAFANGSLNYGTRKATWNAFQLNLDNAIVNNTIMMVEKIDAVRKPLVPMNAKAFMSVAVLMVIIAFVVGISAGYQAVRKDGFQTESRNYGCSMKFGCKQSQIPWEGPGTCSDNHMWARGQSWGGLIRSCPDLKPQCGGKTNGGDISTNCPVTCADPDLCGDCFDDNPKLHKVMSGQGYPQINTCEKINDMMGKDRLCGNKYMGGICAMTCDCPKEEEKDRPPCCDDGSCEDQDEMAVEAAKKNGQTISGCADLAKYCSMAAELGQICPVSCDVCNGGGGGAEGGEAAGAPAPAAEKVCDEDCKNAACADMDEAVKKAIYEKQGMNITGCPDIKAYCDATPQLKTACARTCDGCRPEGNDGPASPQ